MVVLLKLKNNRRFLKKTRADHFSRIVHLKNQIHKYNSSTDSDFDPNMNFTSLDFTQDFPLKGESTGFHSKSEFVYRIPVLEKSAERETIANSSLTFRVSSKKNDLETEVENVETSSFDSSDEKLKCSNFKQRDKIFRLKIDEFGTETDSKLTKDGSISENQLKNKNKTFF